MEYITIKKIDGDFYIINRKSSANITDVMDENFEVCVEETNFRQYMSDSQGMRVDLLFMVNGNQYKINLPQNRLIRVTV